MNYYSSPVTLLSINHAILLSINHATILSISPATLLSISPATLISIKLCNPGHHSSSASWLLWKPLCNPAFMETALQLCFYRNRSAILLL